MQVLAAYRVVGATSDNYGKALKTQLTEASSSFSLQSSIAFVF